MPNGNLSGYRRPDKSRCWFEVQVAHKNTWTKGDPPRPVVTVHQFQTRGASIEQFHWTDACYKRSAAVRLVRHRKSGDDVILQTPDWPDNIPTTL